MSLKLCIWAVCCCVLPLAAFSQPYNYYRGNLHSHTSFSDGTQDCASSHVCTPDEAYEFAKGALHFDFLGISEHNHSSAGMVLSHYAEGVAAADSATDASFVALYGMEWGVISTGGHVLVYGYDSLIGWDPGDYDVYNAEADYEGLFAKVNQWPGAIVTMAHPDNSDYNGLFSSPVDLIADSALVGLAIRSGPAFSTDTTYSDPSYSSYLQRYKDALKHGYHIGASLDHDNHNTTFGRHTPARLIVMAPSLTRQNIMDGMRKLRFYASDDWNAFIDFTVNGQVMGSSLSHAGQPFIQVTVNDQDQETTASIKIFYGVAGSGTNPTVLQSNSGQNALSFTASGLADQTTYYLFAEIKQTDGDMIWTSPVWFTRNDAITSDPPAASFAPTSLNHICEGGSISFLDWSTNAPSAWQWDFPGGMPSASAIANPVVQYATAGIYPVSLKVTNSDGSDSLGQPGLVEIYANPPTPSITVNGNQLTAPAGYSYQWYINGILINGATGQTYSAPQEGNYSVTVTSSHGCKATSAPQLFDVEPVDIASPLHIYPNPTEGAVIMEFTAPAKGSYEIYVTDESGRTVFHETKKLSAGLFNSTFNLEGYSAGLYYITLQHKDQRWVQKLELK